MIYGGSRRKEKCTVLPYRKRCGTEEMKIWDGGDKVWARKHSRENRRRETNCSAN